MSRASGISFEGCAGLSSAYEHACFMAGLGFRMIPLFGIDAQGCQCRRDCGKTAGKHPLIHGWPELATATQAQLADWHADFPGCNWGMLLGPETSVAVLDFDPRNGDAMAQLDAQGLCLPDTFTVLTGMYGGQRGKHCIYQHPGIVLPENAVPGLDIRSSGYIVCLGSLHASGVRYELEPGTPMGIAEIPNSLRDWTMLSGQRRRCQSATSNPARNPVFPYYSPYPSYPPIQDKGGNPKMKPADVTVRLEALLADWMDQAIEPGQSMAAVRELAAKLASTGATDAEAEPVLEKIIAAICVAGRWRCERSPKQFKLDTMDYLVELPRGTSLVEVVIYRAEIDYLKSLKSKILRHFIFFAIVAQRIADGSGRTHFIWPMRSVANYLELALEDEENKTNEQWYESVRYMTSNRFNPASKHYAGHGLSLFTDQRRGNHPQSESYQRGRWTANEYRFGDDYAYAHGDKVPQAEAESILGVLPISPQLLKLLGRRH